MKTRNLPRSSMFSSSLLVAVLLAASLWLTESLLDFLWFNDSGETFGESLIPVQDPHEMIMRLVVASVIFSAGITAGIVMARLRRKEEGLRITLQSIGDAVIATDMDGRVTRMNAVAEMLTGWSMSEAAGKPLVEVFRIISAETREAANNPVEHVLATGEIVGLANHTALIARDGTEHQIADSAAPIRDDKGRIWGVILVFRNVTDEYALRTEMRESRQRMELALSGADLGTWDWDARTGSVVFDKRWAAMLGYSVEELDATVDQWKSLLHPDDVPEVMAALERHMTGTEESYSTEHRLRHKDGHWIWVLDKGRVVEWATDGSPARVCGTHLDITERKQTEAALRSNDALFQSMLNAIPDMVSVHDSDMNIRYSNWNGFGAVPEESQRIGNKCYRVYRGFDSVCPDCQAKTVISNKEPFESEVQLPDGRWVELRVIPILDENRECLLFVEWVRDISGRRQTEDQLNDALRNFQTLFDLLPFSCVINDFDGNVLLANEHFCSVVGKSSDDVIGRSQDSLGRSLDIAERNALINELKEHGRIAGKEVRIGTPRGEATLLISSSIIDWKGDNAVLTATVDITDRKHAEDELSRKEENLRVTLNSIGDAVIATDTDGRVTQMNPVAERLTGWDAGEARGRLLAEVFRIINAQTRKPVESPADRVLATGEIVGLANHTVLVGKDGKEYQIADSGAPIRSSSGDTLGVVLVFRDVTEEYLLQEQLRQSQKLDAIGQLAGGVAHDFNNMLGGIMGGAELLRNHLPKDMKSDRYISMILESAERAADLAGNLLAFSRRQAAGSTPIDIHSVIYETISLLESTIDKRIEIEVDLSAEASMVVGDGAQLQSVFLNLGINSSHAMPDGGRLSYRSTLIDLSEAYCKSSTFDLTPGSYIEIEVRDNGCGISAENLPKIFEPFFTTKEQGKGTGLGLAAAYGTVQQHKGAITVYSEIGKGTCFHILFPITSDAQANLPPLGKPIRGEGLILVVDDEAVMRATGEALLEDLGYNVLLAENGRLAIDVFRERSGDINLVILDMIMPEMNGRDCFAVLREIRPDIPVILSSGFTRSEDLANLKAQGLFGFIQKPFRGCELSQVVSDAMAGKRQ